MTEELNFKKLDGTKIENVNDYVKNWANKFPHGEITIGCDSQEHSKYVKYAVVIVMHKFFESLEENPNRMGHGAHLIKAILFDKKHKTPKGTLKIKDGMKFFDTGVLSGKLWKEVELTVKAAQMLEDCNKKVKIHVDYNSDKKTASNVLYASGIGYAQSFGFEAEGKPYAWASSTVADRLCR